MPNRVKQSELNGSTGAPTASVLDRWKRLKEQTARGGLTWSDAPAEDLRDAIASATEDGAAVLLSKTSDGGALVLRIITDSASTPFYPASSSALNEILLMVVESANKP